MTSGSRTRVAPEASPWRRPSAGFTLIELMVVMSLIVVLVSIGLTLYGNSVTRTKEAVLKEDLFRLRDAIDQYYADKNRYPASLDDLVAEKYIRAIPVDPFTNTADSWQTVLSEPQPGDASATQGIYDVKSGAQQTAIDGSNYSDWE